MQLLFSDLELEEHVECYFDYVEIFDGRSSAARSLGRYCSLNAVPHQIVSTTNQMFVRMISDINNQGRGFDLKFSTSKSDAYANHKTNSQRQFNSLVCSREIRTHRGVIESPNFPTKYPNNLNCNWKIIAPPGNKILIAFSQFETEDSYGESMPSSSAVCEYDYLEIVQGRSEDKESSQSGQSGDKYCRSMPKQFTSVGDIVDIK